MQYQLLLYVAGQGELATAARRNLDALVETHLSADQYELEEIDVLTDPVRAMQDHVVVTPMLIVVQPEPMQRIVGDLSDQAKVLSVLRIPPSQSDATP